MPEIIGNFAPYFATSPPAQGENKKRTITRGTKARPALAAEYPCNCIRLKGIKNIAPLHAAQKNNVTKFPPLKVFDLSGFIIFSRKYFCF